MSQGSISSTVIRPAKRVRAAVQVSREKLVIEEFERPSIGVNDAILRVEACGICGTDIESFKGNLERMMPYPFIPGHEPLGIIDEIGDAASKRWGVAVGDRVAVESLITCGTCAGCLAGDRTLCARYVSYGFGTRNTTPPVWGAYSDFMYLHPDTVMHKMSMRLPPEIAVIYNPLGGGVRWTTTTPNMKAGDTVVILGAGQRGLCCVVAAKAAGASKIIVTDIERAAHKLELAREFGADHTIVVDCENAVQQVERFTDGRLADIVVDVSVATQPIVDAIDMVRIGGTIVVAGVKGDGVKTSLITDKLVFRSITLKGVFTVDGASYQEAVRLLESNAAPFAKMHSATFGLAQVEQAIHRLAGTDGKPPAIHVAIKPS